MRKLVMICLCIAAIGSTPAALAWTSADTPETPDDMTALPNAWNVQEQERQTLRQIEDRLRKPGADYAILAQHLRDAVEAHTFTTLNPSERHTAYLFYAAALYSSRQYENAVAPFARACEMPQASAADWDLRFRNAVAGKNYEDAARAVIGLAQRWPQALTRYDGHVIANVINAVRRDPGDAALDAELEAALRAAHFDLVPAGAGASRS
ncbi:MAG: hypothetical protein JO167_00775 [Alphaproteobacteria bacterium]|nr:hypothetical protein [Alphaproteobacteria bacterium]